MLRGLLFEGCHSMTAGPLSEQVEDEEVKVSLVSARNASLRMQDAVL